MLRASRGPRRAHAAASFACRFAPSLANAAACTLLCLLRKGPWQGTSYIKDDFHWTGSKSLSRAIAIESFCSHHRPVLGDVALPPDEALGVLSVFAIDPQRHCPDLLLAGDRHENAQTRAMPETMTCRPSRITNSILSPDSCRSRSGPGTPTLASPRPCPCKPLCDQLIANGAPRAVQGSKGAAVTILAFTGDLKGSCIKKLHQSVPRAKR